MTIKKLFMNKLQKKKMNNVREYFEIKCSRRNASVSQIFDISKYYYNLSVPN